MLWSILKFLLTLDVVCEIVICLIRMTIKSKKTIAPEPKMSYSNNHRNRKCKLETWVGMYNYVSLLREGNPSRVNNILNNPKGKVRIVNIYTKYESNNTENKEEFMLCILLTLLGHYGVTSTWYQDSPMNFKAIFYLIFTQSCNSHFELWRLKSYLSPVTIYNNQNRLNNF